LAETFGVRLDRRHIAVDVLVVGLGPAGSSAAWAVAKAGLSVIGIDKKRHLGEPVQCAEFIPMPLGAYAASSPVRVQTVEGMKTYLPSGAVEESPFPGIMIDRAQFDRALAAKARQAGATLYDDTRLTDIDPVGHSATILFRDHMADVHYRYLVAADGPHSIVARFLGLDALDTVNTRQYTVPLLKPYFDTDIWLSDNFPGGYAWLFPKGDVANIGMGADKLFQPDLKIPLDDLHRQLVLEGVLGETILSRTGGAIPVGGIRKTLVEQDVVFVGDAAGLTHPITGAGIASAVQSGEWAGSAIADTINGDTEALGEYVDEVFEQYGTTIGRAVERRLWLKHFWRGDRANDDEIMRRGWIAFDEYFEEQHQELAAVL